jgi:hypothetical protein
LWNPFFWNWKLETAVADCCLNLHVATWSLDLFLKILRIKPSVYFSCKKIISKSIIKYQCHYRNTDDPRNHAPNDKHEEYLPKTHD